MNETVNELTHLAANPKAVTGAALTAQAAPIAAEAGLLDTLLGQGLSILGICALCFQTWALVKKERRDRTAYELRMKIDQRELAIKESKLRELTTDG